METAFYQRKQPIYINRNSSLDIKSLQLVFTRSAPASCFPALFTSRLFSHALHKLYVLPPFSRAACFPALCTGYTFSRPFHRPLVFPRFALVTRVFPLFSPAACFPALCTSHASSRSFLWLLSPPTAMCPGFDSRTRRHMWVEFVVGSLPCSERFFKHNFCPGHKICVRNKCCARGQTGKHSCWQQCVLVCQSL